MKPVSIDQISDQVISIVWDDDHESIYFADHLRKNCPCAECSKDRNAEESGPFKILKADIKNVRISGWRMVGRYAVSFTFSDGHKTGIYLYETLRNLCQCDLCDDNVIRIQGPLR